jgi:transcriptional regulator with XRE-family HTH domain
MLQAQIGGDTAARPKAVQDADKVIGKRVRAIRMMRGVSQTTLAEGIGITFQQVQKYENGSNRMSVGRLIQAARFLKTPVADFLEGLEDTRKAKKSDDPALEFATTRTGRELAALWPYASADFQRAFLSVLRVLKRGDA